MLREYYYRFDRVEVSSGRASSYFMRFSPKDILAYPGMVHYILKVVFDVKDGEEVMTAEDRNELDRFYEFLDVDEYKHCRLNDKQIKDTFLTTV